MSRSPPPKTRPWLRALMRLALLASVALAGFGVYNTDFGRAFGSEPDAESQRRLDASEHYEDGVVKNTIPTEIMSGSDYFTMLWRWSFEPTQREPEHALSFPGLDPTLFARSPRSRLRLTWLGHSSVLIEIDGQRVLTDPVFSERVSPFSSLGPQRFFAPPLANADFPTLDAVIISHDHYDHLDHRSIQDLARVTQKFLVPLGVASHLRGWGIEAEKVIELDWWQSVNHAGLEFTATPARHFSGRGLTDRNHTMWASWVIVGPKHRVFFTGDTGYFPGFAEIGERYGPFDAALVEAGAYDTLWASIHLGPDNVVKVHRDVRARVLLPVHWGTFNLAIHDWTEPIERLRQLSKQHDLKLAQPYPGQPFETDGALPAARWWD